MSLPRWLLQAQAFTWRTLMNTGMILHKMAPPQPPYPTYTIRIPTTVSPVKGEIDLLIYCPEDCHAKKANPSHRYPLMINFHGGGFTLGDPSDDVRWAMAVMAHCDAIVVSVGYRLAPEYPFPTAVEDGVDAILWCEKDENCEKFGWDRERICISGFSAGGNMAFTVVLRLREEILRRWGKKTAGIGVTEIGIVSNSAVNTTLAGPASPTRLPGVTEVAVAPTTSNSSSPLCLDPQAVAVREEKLVSEEVPDATAVGAVVASIITYFSSPPPVNLQAIAARDQQIVSGEDKTKEEFLGKIVGICAWYPSTDFTIPRDQRRATNKRQDKELPKLFTDLFDASYLYPPKSISMSSPYLSPGVAPVEMLKSLPDDIILITCEWDELLSEAERFRDRLTSPEEGINKRVTYWKVEGVMHGWDKSPNPVWRDPLRDGTYKQACDELKRIWYGEDAVPKPVVVLSPDDAEEVGVKEANMTMSTVNIGVQRERAPAVVN